MSTIAARLDLHRMQPPRRRRRPTWPVSSATSCAAAARSWGKPQARSAACSACCANATSPLPLLVASACPGGPLTAACYRQLKTELLDRLRDAGPIDGVLLALHGSASAADVGDLEGDLLQAVRALVGPNNAGGRHLDLHAHVTGAMVQRGRRLLAWETYPHRDAYATGGRGARYAARHPGRQVPADHGAGEGAGPGRRRPRPYRRRRAVRRRHALRQESRGQGRRPLHQRVPRPPVPRPARHGRRRTRHHRQRHARGGRPGRGNRPALLGSAFRP